MCAMLTNAVSSAIILVEVFVSASRSCQSQELHMTPDAIFLLFPLLFFCQQERIEIS